MKYRRQAQAEEFDPFKTPEGLWTDRVVQSPSRPYAYRPRQLLVGRNAITDDAFEAFTEILGLEFRQAEIFDGELLLEVDEDFDIDLVVAELRDLGIPVEPNYVMFVHSVSSGHHSCCCVVCASGAAANPFNANPFNANPFNANPFNANPFNANGDRPSSARPAEIPERLDETDETPELRVPDLPAGVARGIILDTGIAQPNQLPDLLQDQPAQTGADAEDYDFADKAEDGYLDPVSGHGTFIAGILEQLAPKQEVHVTSVLSTFGDGDVASISQRLDDLRDARLVDERTVINMSFGSYGEAEMRVLARAVRRVQLTGAVVVASAGNDNTSMPSFPACLPGVISVGSIESYGKAPYSNYGCWVRACAPGTDITSAFFREFEGKMDPEINGDDPDNFAEWAQWTGTSFAAPVVAAALMRHIALTGSTAKEAVEVVIDSPGLLRYPGLGTVVNLVPGM